MIVITWLSGCTRITTCQIGEESGHAKSHTYTAGREYHNNNGKCHRNKSVQRELSSGSNWRRLGTVASFDQVEMRGDGKMSRDVNTHTGQSNAIQREREREMFGFKSKTAQG